MALHFQDKPEIPLGRPPIVEVICQVRFPAILKLMRAEPAEFQEMVKHLFPDLQVQVEQLTIIDSSAVSGMDIKTAPQSKAYKFQMMDAMTTIVLAANFFAVTTTRYTQWKEFLSFVTLGKDALDKVYQPAYASRIGLRYVNRFAPSNTGSASINEVYRLLQPELTAQLRSLAWSSPEQFQSRLQLTNGSGRLTLSTSYQSEPEEQAFVLDLDYFEEGKINLSEVEQRCDHYHNEIYRAFRWCVLDESLPKFDARVD